MGSELDPSVPQTEAGPADHPPLTEASLAMIRDCAAWGIDPALAATSLVAVEEQAREEGYKAANYIRDAIEAQPDTGGALDERLNEARDRIAGVFADH